SRRRLFVETVRRGPPGGRTGAGAGEIGAGRKNPGSADRRGRAATSWSRGTDPGPGRSTSSRASDRESGLRAGAGRLRLFPLRGEGLSQGTDARRGRSVVRPGEVRPDPSFVHLESGTPRAGRDRCEGKSSRDSDRRAPPAGQPDWVQAAW